MELSLKNTYWSNAVDEIQKSLNENASFEVDSSNGEKYSADELAQTIDHTLLKLDATPEQVEKLCQEAKQYKFKTVCVRLDYVSQAFKALQGSGVDVCCVVGFHEGTHSTEEKLSESKQALDAGAAELDVVLNYPQLKAQDYAGVAAELSKIRAATRGTNGWSGIRAGSAPLLKLILETSQLATRDIIAAVALAAEAEFDFVKTSTGFMGHGAKVEHVRLMKRVAQAQHEQKGTKMLKVKASGGIRTLQDAQSMITAGASRIGASAGISIIHEASTG